MQVLTFAAVKGTMETSVTDRVRICRKFTLEMAHALEGHDGLCANIHGHSYKLIVAVEGVPLQSHGHAKDGMVMDYSDLKQIVKVQILDLFDHALVLKESFSFTGATDRLVRTPYQPTCENLLLDFARRLKTHLPADVTLVSLELWETENNGALWVG